VDPDDILQLDPGEFAADDSSDNYAGLEPAVGFGPVDPSTVPLPNLDANASLLLPVPTDSGAIAPGPSISTTTSTTNFSNPDLDSFFGVNPANTDTTTGTGGAVGDLSPILGSALGTLVGDGLNALQGTVIAPAIAQASLPAQTASAQLAAESQAASASTVTGSITTILLWAAIAYGLVIIFSDVGRRA
jgi:hypothetical protein